LCGTITGLMNHGQNRAARTFNSLKLQPPFFVLLPKAVKWG